MGSFILKQVDFVGLISTPILKFRTPYGIDSTVAKFTYDLQEHTRFFRSSTTLGRLQLAAILTASGTMLRDLYFKATGSEVAIELVRQCTTNKPLESAETTKLKTLDFVAYREPALKLICHKLKWVSDRILFLYSADDSNVMNVSQSKQDVETEYLFLSGASLLNSRRALTSNESSIVVSRTHSRVTKLYLSSQNTDNVCEGIFDLKYVRVTSDTLSDIVKIMPSSNDNSIIFPLESNNRNILLDQISSEISNSWNAFHKQPKMIIESQVLRTIDGVIISLQFDVNIKLQKMQHYLIEKISPQMDQSRQFRLDVIRNRSPEPVIRDLLLIATSQDHVKRFNPFFTESETDEYRDCVLVYLETLVFKEKLLRIAKLVDGPKNLLIEELLNKRNWDIKQYPEWLVFEVEGGIQIRPEQYTIASHLLNNPTSITQLNMGRGKTRVILPMMIMDLVKNRPVVLPRIMFLAALLWDTVEFLHETLTASVLNIPLFLQPFNRSVTLDRRKIFIMRELRNMAKGGFQVQSPGFKLSLDLKCMEMQYENDGLYNELKDFIDETNAFDILDESDAILHQKYQLVYAIGLPGALDNQIIRCLVAEGVLQILNDNPQILSLLNEVSGFGSFSVSALSGTFKGIRLAEREISLDRAFADLKEHIISGILKTSPFELQIICELVTRYPHLVGPITQAISDPTTSIDMILKGLELPSLIREYLLILRGYLAYGIFESVISRRYRVDYGFDDQRVKRLAVPFLAADMPSRKAEFSHPDVGIFLTVLSFYNQGLTRVQFSQALEQLLDENVNAQSFHYNLWLDPIRQRLPQKVLEMIGKSEKLDPNELQMEVLFATFRFSMACINYFLNKCVFPFDTAQYPSRLCKSAWDIPSKGSTVGFSGTKDNHYCLPRSVYQNEPEDVSLNGTDGQMLYLVMTQTIGYETLSGNSILWQQLLFFAIINKYSALIDTGSLLAGVLNKDAAHFLASQSEFDSSFLGVVYFDTEYHEGQWMVLNRKFGISSPKSASVIHVLKVSHFRNEIASLFLMMQEPEVRI